ncbi:hypothetical protein [Microbispora sp. NPDC049125]|uniref:hypothetical protein n=1 Tax=Microbispora sp. NPDC049125 TaxID=3154929 RepID=UPI003467567A
MNFPPDDEYGELLRRAMRAEADSVVPSPEGLEIIRTRIDSRRGLFGLRGMPWWRIGASAAGAVLVAGTVVMVIPDLRTQVAETVGIAPANGGENQPPDTGTSSVTRPPMATPPGVVPPIASASPRAHASPLPSHKTGPTAKPNPARPHPCPSPTAGVVEPDATVSPTCSPRETSQPTTPRPTTPSTPTAGPTVSLTPSPTPTPADTPTETPTSQAAEETPAS